jgi:hypothetical protein
MTSRSATIAGSDAGDATRHRGHPGVAVLLASAALLAGVISIGASIASSAAGDSWQAALRMEVKRSAGAMNDGTNLYQAELPIANRILEARTLSTELKAAALSAPAPVRDELLAEARIQDSIVGLAGSLDLTAETYRLPSGGYDLGKRLADLRATAPDLLALDPDAMQAAGDRQANKALLLTYTLLPTGAAAIFGVLAQPFLLRRRLLLSVGTSLVVFGAAAALGVEALA